MFLVLSLETIYCVGRICTHWLNLVWMFPLKSVWKRRVKQTSYFSSSVNMDSVVFQVSFVWPSVQPSKWGMLSSSENICKDIYWGIKGNKRPQLLVFILCVFSLLSAACLFFNNVSWFCFDVHKIPKMSQLTAYIWKL